MSCKPWTLLAVVLVVAVIGCGGSDETPAAGDGNTEANSNQTTSAEEQGPAEAVAQFLDSFIDGDDEKTEAMLTDRARQQAAANNMVVAPPGSDTAKFKLGRVAYLPDDRAAVSCEWTDLDEEATEYVWMLRREPEGWRIAGVAAPVFDGEPPIQLDFEDVEQMQSKLNWVRDERLRRAKQADTRANPTENSQNSVSR